VALDPFMGTGASLLAAAELDVEAIGIELDPRYCTAARRRLALKASTVPTPPAATARQTPPSGFDSETGLRP
jgi:tRNA G10  N-methylase Trm11